MATYRFMRSATALGAICAASLLASPAMAGRCGGFYPVDTPTTLSKVARACNVSLAALKEANPGVDPAYVGPGEHLAVPDEGVTAVADVPVVSDGVEAVDEGYANPRAPRYVEYSGDGGVWQASAAKPNAASTQPYYYQTSVTGGGLIHSQDADHLPYQKRSALRIRAAGLPVNPVLPTFTPDYLAPDYSGLPEFISATPGERVSPLMECTVLRRQSNGKITQVREFKPLPDGREAPAHCAALPVSSRAISAATGPLKITPALQSGLYADLPPLDEPTMLKGYVSALSDGCLTLIGDDGAFSRIDGRGVADGLVGREATLWVEYTDNASCGGVALDHAVYAERVPAVGALTQ